ncbi:unnamed protein product [Cuscuta epithymum]|uniref:FMR1-interacting protein 1 conserved domain-containing protein n=1 Tax=Cuscuta epithymum TaxID=186058 RepID=A0AAV0EPN5_9ASTE|nr:unnamed protein product [Cuscuta epithymum]
MFPPPFSSQPRPSSQVNSKGLTGPATPQVMGNPGMQMPPQMGSYNPQGSSTPNIYPSAPRFPFQAPQNPTNNVGVPQIPGQFFAPNNFATPAPFFNMNANAMMPNNQWNTPNNALLQTVNQLLQVQMQLQMQLQNPNFSQVGLSPLPFYANNQAPHNGGLQDPNFGVNAQFLLANLAAQQMMNPNLLEQPQQGNIPSMAQPHLNQSSSNPPDAATSQGGLGHATRINSKGPWKSSFNNNFNRSQGNEATHSGFGKPTTQSFQNAKKNFSIHNDSQVKGHTDGSTEKSFKKQNQMEKKRPLPLFYTEQEVRQWREERKKHYPSKDNIEKKSQKLAKAEENVHAANLRRQRLKEILAKQAELGCEIAEIPSSYLSDLERPHNERGDKRRPFNKKDRYQYKPNKRGRFGQRNSFCRKPNIEYPTSSEIQEQRDDHSKEQKSENKREPSLLQKLLCADITRDKRHLLQVFRFMVMNSFFVECPEKPLKFPSVMVKESVSENLVVGQGSPMEEPFLNDVECKDETCLGNDKSIIGDTGKEEHQEEGEIID